MREMKDSGVAWIGAVPSDFAISSIGSLFTIKKDIAGREPETVLSITQTGIRPKDLSSNEGQNASSYAHYQIVNVGDFAMNHMDLLTGWIDISKYEGVTSPDYRVFTLNDKKMSADYFLRVFQYYYTNRVFFGFGQGVATLGRWRLPAINFKKIDVPVPPILEQQRIVTAIDENVSKVDVLIANVQAQIEKLEAYKQSLITEVVTKGLDPTVPMKDSGVEWIGNIPAHWTANKIIRCFGVIGSGTTPTSADDALFEGDINWIQSGDINGSVLSETRFQITRDIVEETSALKVYSAPFIVIAMYGASIGNLSISQIDACTNQACCVLSKPVNGLLLEYLFYAFKPAKDYLIWRADGGGQPNISQEKLKSLWIPIPPNEDQVVIVQHLNKKCGQIDYLIALKQSKIEKLEQYKRSLIYEYVTGKREVSCDE